MVVAVSLLFGSEFELPMARLEGQVPLEPQLLLLDRDAHVQLPNLTAVKLGMLGTAYPLPGTFIDGGPEGGRLVIVGCVEFGVELWAGDSCNKFFCLVFISKHGASVILFILLVWVG